MNVCEIIVNPNDNTRLDLNVSNEQYLYLKANNEKERQQWLVALGSAKAGLANRQRRQRISSTTSSTFSDFSNQAIPQLSNPSEQDVQILKSKKVELRLYCDLLMQEIHKVKNGEETDENMISATCDTFIQTLDDMMELADQQYNVYSNRRVRFKFLMDLRSYSSTYRDI